MMMTKVTNEKPEKAKEVLNVVCPTEGLMKTLTLSEAKEGTLSIFVPPQQESLGAKYPRSHEH